MYQRSAHEPGHERRILDRIPEPPTAPAELVVSPETPERDTAGEKHPCNGGPWPRPARPGRVKPAANQRRDRKSKSDGETNVAHVKHRRVSHHRRILEQRIEIATVRRRGKETRKRIRRKQHEQQKAHTDDSHH